MDANLTLFIRRYCKKYKNLLFLQVISVLLWATTLSLTPYSLKLLIDAMTGEKELLGPSTFFLSLILGTSIVLRMYDYWILRTFPKMKSDIIAEMTERLLQNPLSYFQERLSGSLSSKTLDLAKGIAHILHCLIDQFCGRLLALVMGIIVMFVVHPLFSLGVVVWSLYFLRSSYNWSGKAREIASQCSKSRQQAAGTLVDAFSNILNVKLFFRSCGFC